MYSGIFTFLVDAYPLYAASALAANSFARSSFAAAFPLFGVQVCLRILQYEPHSAPSRSPYLIPRATLPFVLLSLPLVALSTPLAGWPGSGHVDGRRF